MSTRRQRKVAELLHQEISQLIQYSSRDPRLGFVTVTGVDVSPDLRLAHVYVTVLGDETEAQSTLEGLASAAGYFRHNMKKDLSLRYIPELRFKLDTSLQHGLRIDSLLDTIKNEADQLENPSEDESSE